MPGKQLQDKIDRWFKKDYRETFLERIHLIFESEELFAGQPDAVIYGNTLRHILEGISVCVREDDIFAGCVKESIPTEQEYETILKRYRKWWDIPIEERHKKTLFYYSEGWLKCRPPFFISYGHLAPDWEGIINNGLKQLKDDAEEKLKTNQEECQKNFMQGLIICYDAISAFIMRYAKQARKQGKSEMADSLAHVAYHGARTFYEALALIWMLVLVCQKICGCGVLNFSRMDQYLLPYYVRDLKHGVIDERQAVELLEEFYFLNNEIMVQVDHMSQETDQTQYTLEVAYDDPNYLIVAGKKMDGPGGVNMLSSLMVQAAHNLKLRNPFIVVRYYDGIDPKFMKQVFETMRDNTTMVIYNDETMIPALKRYGVQEPEVYDYGFYGCNDPDISAYEGGLRQVWVNLVKPLELALNRGDYPMQPGGKGKKDCEFSLEDRMTGLMTGAYYGVDTGELDRVQCMDDVVALYQKQLDYLMKEYRNGFEADFEIEKECSKGRMRIEDCFLIGPREQAMSWTQGGTKYHKIVTQGTGMATVADALYAIERLVFKEKQMTLKEFAALLANDFGGNEFLSQILKKKYEKFGNDIDKVDKYAVAVVDAFVAAVEKCNGDEYLYQMFPTLSSDRDFTTMGLYVGATPDGRRHKERLSENQSPSEGADIFGVTAMLNSVAKIPFDKITGGPLNIRIHPGMVKDEAGVEVLSALLETYLKKGGMQVQINVIDAESLRKAQLQPEAYRNLCVRVTGYSAFFVEMGKKAQEELIRRTEQLV